MTMLLVIISSVILLEITLQLKMLHIMQEISLFGKKTFRTLNSLQVSDHWKEKVILHYALKIMSASVRLLGIFLVLCVFLLGMDWILQAVTGGVVNIIDDLTSAIGLMVASISALLYYHIRQNFA
tara:strand:+ start:80 stop:454 length:375 start_codon:yes stop_codon:yes gene_type:complete